jgi:phage terminase large subunit-like protein
MADVLDHVGALERWQHEPCRFIAEILRDPETGQPFRLLPAEIAFFDHCYRTDDAGRLIYADQLYSAPKKSGKTTLAALHVLTTTLIYGGRFAEGICAANDFDQSVGRVFKQLTRIVEASPLLRREAKVLADRIEFPATGATITAIASDYAGAAGANPTISCFDELWAYVSERSRRLWDEMVSPPTRKIACRLTTTYAGFEGESALLESLYQRGHAQPQIGTDLHAGDGLLMFWTHQPIAPWQDEKWLTQMRRSLRVNQYLRMIENRFVTGESAFVEMDAWRRCINPNGGPLLADRTLPVWLGIDAGVKHDSSAIAVTTFDRTSNKVKLVTHKVFQPTAKEPLDFEQTIERSVRELCQRFRVKRCLYDPYQMAAVAQRLTKAGAPMREFPQTVPNLTAIGSALYEMIRGGNLIVYPDDGLQLAISRAIAVETPRGWRITKEKSSHKIDIVISLAMAAYGAIQQSHVQPVKIVEPAVYSKQLGWIGTGAANTAGKSATALFYENGGYSGGAGRPFERDW